MNNVGVLAVSADHVRTECPSGIYLSGDPTKGRRLDGIVFLGAWQDNPKYTSEFFMSLMPVLDYPSGAKLIEYMMDTYINVDTED